MKPIFLSAFPLLLFPLSIGAQQIDEGCAVTGCDMDCGIANSANKEDSTDCPPSAEHDCFRRYGHCVRTRDFEDKSHCSWETAQGFDSCLGRALQKTFTEAMKPHRKLSVDPDFDYNHVGTLQDSIGQ
jgi:hypothetical protein